MLLALILLPSMIEMSHIKHAMTVATTATSNKLLKAMTAMRNIKRVKHPTITMSEIANIESAMTGGATADCFSESHCTEPPNHLFGRQSEEAHSHA